MSIGSFGALGLCIQKDGFAMHSLHSLCSYSLSLGEDMQMQDSPLLKSACTSGFVSLAPQNFISISKN